MSAKLIRIQDLATLLGKPVRHMDGWLARMGLEIRTHHGHSAVSWPLLADSLDAQSLRKITQAAKKLNFSLELRTWTVASFPKLLAQWDQRKNHGLEPNQVTFRSEETIWWRCSEGDDHAWQAMPTSRIRKEADGSYTELGCPFCSLHRATRLRSLAKEFPEVAREWHPTLNGTLKPRDVSPKSSKRAFWRCPKKHVWEAEVRNRTSAGSGCPYCAGTLLVPENSLAVKQPALAAQWHPTKNGTLKPSDVSAGSRREIWWKCPVEKDHEWQAFPASRCRTSSCPFCVNKRTAPSNCLARKFPKLAREWHPTKNGDLTAHDIVPASGRKVWWKCPRGSDHEWQAVAYHRTQRNHSCPFCAGKRVSETNSLEGTYPKIATQWHPRRNGKLKPSQVLATSKTPVWWRCPIGHEWRAPVHARTALARGCPLCIELGGTARLRM